MEPINEQWKCDEAFFIHSPRNFFHIKDFQYLIRHEETNVVLAFVGCQLQIDFKNQENRDNMYDWLIMCRKNYERVCDDHKIMHHAMSKAQLEIQNRMAGAVMDHNHP